MSNTNLTIDLKRRVDKNGQVFFVGKLRGPVFIDCSDDGVVFLIYTSDQGAEELQIASMDEKNKREMED
jgi:hypothetical protein